MKRLISTAAMFLLVFVGCSNQENSITGPISENVEQFSRTTIKTAVINTVDETVNKLAATSKLINGVLGGVLSLNQDILNSEGRVIHVSANFKISIGAFVGIKKISMTVDADNGCISFFPHMNFLNSCKLDYELQNMNLTSLGFTAEDKQVQFVYFNDSGSIEPIESLESKIDFNTGYLKVKQAKIDHFSRYGFMR